MTGNNDVKPRILIVDDASENLHAMMSLLGDTYAVTAATTGEKALELAVRKPQPDLVLLDIKMPGMDGYEVLHRLKTDPLTTDIPVIIVTTSPESEDEAKGLMMGAADYIAKPVNPDGLKLRILTQLELRRFRRKPISPDSDADGAPQEHLGILVVDDVPENIHQLISVLSGEYRIIVADNGPKAIELVLGPTPPDLVLLDILMPDMDGYEICRRIKATEAGNHIPVIFLSMIDAPMEKIRGFSIGAADFITKPFDIDEVRARIRTHLDLSLLHRFFEQKVAEQTASLRQSERQLSEALRIAKVGYWEYEFATDEFVFNDQYYALLKITAGEAGGYRMSSADFARRYVHPEDAPIVGQQAQLAFESADPDYFAMVEARILTGKGEIVWIEVRFRIEKDAQGRTIRLIGVNQDITARKLAEDVLRQSEEERRTLESQLHQAQKIESIGQLAGGVAHDFNNMLGVILGHAELAMIKSNPSNPFYSDLEAIRDAAERSADLTRQLLTFARKQVISPIFLDLNETVEVMLKMLQRLIGEEIQLSWSPATDLWPVKVDPSQIDQILANLCVNARDAISGPGKITIKTGNSSFDEKYCGSRPFVVSPGDYACLSVSDDGCGMDQAVKARIFEPFYTTKAIGSGTGLGLATVYGAVKQNNGFITFTSESGQGTVFNIYLPRVDSTPQTVIETENIAIRHGTESILLVEDDAMLLQLQKFMLEESGYTVLAAATTDLAICLAREHPGPIQLLISDVVMPSMNGKQLSEALKDLRPGMKTLFVSGYTSDIISDKGVVEAGVHFLQKPFSFETLTAKVRKVLDSP